MRRGVTPVTAALLATGLAGCRDSPAEPAAAEELHIASTSGSLRNALSHDAMVPVRDALDRLLPAADGGHDVAPLRAALRRIVQQHGSANIAAFRSAVRDAGVALDDYARRAHDDAMPDIEAIRLTLLTLQQF